MKISHYLKKEACIMKLGATNKEEAIREVASALASSGRLIDEEQFIRDVLGRESLGSTGIGHNIGIPHARTKAVKSFVIGFGKSDAGIDFQSLDGQKVNLVFLMGADPKELNLYLRLLAELSKLLMNESFRKELLSAHEADRIVEVIRKFEGS
ncbi:MAG: PTS sugar transporter subunit IIA [Candidatus Omnitrophota bacterium]|nr:MAG: PTS sugar transporter subunit IIA [Candidatus Omnitrophota bacterium]